MGPQPLVRIELLGGLRVVQEDRILTRFRSQRVACLLAYLAYRLGDSHPREVLVELLWPGGTPDSGRNNLRVSLASLRRQLEPPGVPVGAVLQADAQSVRLNPDAVTTDVEDLKRAAAQADRAHGAEERVHLLSAAADVCRGPLLPGFYDDWVLREQEWIA